MIIIVYIIVSIFYKKARHKNCFEIENNNWYPLKMELKYAKFEHEHMKEERKWVLRYGDYNIDRISFSHIYWI